MADPVYKLATEYRGGFGWQFTVYKDGAVSIRRGTYETEQEARAAGLRLMSHPDAPPQFEFQAGTAGVALADHQVKQPSDADGKDTPA